MDLQLSLEKDGPASSQHSPGEVRQEEKLTEETAEHLGSSGGRLGLVLVLGFLLHHHHRL